MISVVVPLLNEEHSLETLYREIANALEPLDHDFEVVFVDDGSTDGSLTALGRLHDETENIVVVHLRRNFGKATALQAGFLEARGDLVVTIDADLQDDPAEIPKLLAKLDEGFDLVSGWKTRRNDPVTRRLFSRVFNWMTGVISGVRWDEQEARAEPGERDERGAIPTGAPHDEQATGDVAERCERGVDDTDHRDTIATCVIPAPPCREPSRGVAPAY